MRSVEWPSQNGGDAAGLAVSREDDLGSGNDFCRICLRVALHLADERSNLREIGASAYNVDDFSGWGL
jgi:hypothetical protein